MKYLLDTNTCIRYINGRSQKILLSRCSAANIIVFGQDVVSCDEKIKHLHVPEYRT